MIRKIKLDCKKLKNKEDFHRAIAEQMDFAHYYGNNLDALWDQLTQLEEFEIKLINSKYLVFNLRKYGEDLIELFDDLKNESDKYKISFY